jgi:hypothetical protein
MERMLSVGQEALWLLYRMAPQSAAYNVAWAMRVRGSLDVTALCRAFGLVAGRHDLLRSRFVEREGTPRRIVCDEPISPLEIRYAANADDERVRELVHDEIARPFTLETDGAARLVLLQVGAGDAALVLVTHHIATDFASLSLVVRELFQAYQAVRAGAEPDWQPLRHTYDDFVTAERRMLGSARGEEMAAYWRSVLADAPTGLELPLDRPRPPERRYAGAVHTFQLPADVVAGLQPAARAARVTPVRHLIGVFQALLQRYTGQDDFLVGCDAASGMSLAHRGVVGYYTNRVVLRARCDAFTTFADLVAGVHRQLTEGAPHTDFPFSMLHRVLGLPSRSATAGLGQAAVSMITVNPADPLVALATRSHGSEVDHAGLSLTALDMPQQAGQSDLTLEVIRSRTSVHCAVKYDADLFLPGTIRRMGDHFVRLLRAAADDPGRRVSSVGLVDQTERERLLAFATGRSHHLAEGASR